MNVHRQCVLLTCEGQYKCTRPDARSQEANITRNYAPSFLGDYR